MITRQARHWKYRLKALKDRVDWRIRKSRYESCFFYTFHKCASTLFSSFLLKNIVGLRHVDYAKQIYLGESFGDIQFDRTGFVYGPIRISSGPKAPVFELLVEPTCGSEFIRDKIALFLIRDPRDILVSAYYSFGFTHGLSKSEKIRELQLQDRNKIQTKTLDEYALKTACNILQHYETVDRLTNVCNRSIVLKYEDMIYNWDLFVNDLTKYITIKEPTLAQLFEASRPRDKENIRNHRRSGRPYGFKSKFKEETLISLNEIFKNTLSKFHYVV